MVISKQLEHDTGWNTWSCSEGLPYLCDKFVKPMVPRRCDKINVEISDASFEGAVKIGIAYSPLYRNYYRTDPPDSLYDNASKTIEKHFGQHLTHIWIKVTPIYDN